MGNSFRYLYAKNYQCRTWFERVIEKIKMVQFLPHRLMWYEQTDVLFVWLVSVVDVLCV